jgi:hypothetical protein
MTRNIAGSNGFSSAKGRAPPKNIRVVAVVVMVSLSALLSASFHGNQSDAIAPVRESRAESLPVYYQCPSNALPITAENFHPQMTEGYEKVSQSLTSDMQDFLNTFRQKEFDEWGQSYEQIKAGMKHFKSKYYPKYLKEGDTIYESACGTGLNLYMTLEILKETSGIENLIVYGNELFGASANKANAVYDHIAPAKSRKGVICAANSVHLDFVPENSFDLVYTGYLYQLMDPLNLDLGESAIKIYEGLCTASANLEAASTIVDIAQKRQNDWYGHWVAEMARIAKPGVPVIVEQVSLPKCNDFSDWGGVLKEWWVETAKNNTYGWNVDPSSVEIENDTIFGTRYHVFMLKNGNRANVRSRT